MRFLRFSLVAFGLMGWTPGFVTGATGALQAQAVAPIDPKAEAFEVTYVGADALYIDGGSNSGLEEGMRLSIRRRPPGASLGEGESVAEIVIFAVTATSAACEVVSLTQPIQVGDSAYLSPADRAQQLSDRGFEASIGYVQLVGFTGGDPLGEEMRESMPRPPLPEANRVRGRIGIDHSSIYDRSGSERISHQENLVLRTEMTRLGGSYWNFTGHWRGRINARQRGAGVETLRDLLSRVYNIGLFYNNPNSSYMIGVGRVLLPWAGTLNTLDGGYFGRRFGPVMTLGAFAGTTPDPTAWNYDADRQMVGAFANFESGDVGSVRHSGTVGVAFTQLVGMPERRFLFLENSLQFGRGASVHQNMEVDQNSRGRFGVDSDGPVLSRSSATVRIRPGDRLLFDLNHNYFRLPPTFDPRLVGTGLLDDLLFEGVSGGVRIDITRNIALYTHLGRSERKDDPKATLNRSFGVTWNRVPWLGIRTDARYSLFEGIVGSGTYKSMSVSHYGERTRVEVRAGTQDFSTALAETRARFVNADIDWLVGSSWIIRTGGTAYRGNQQSYDQISFGLNYRFSSNRPVE